MYAIRRLSTVLMTVAGVMLLLGGRAEALTAGTGRVMVTVNLIGRTLNISATFDSATYDLGVNLGPVGTVSAMSVALSNVNAGTGASFVVPFANASNSFHAAGDIACPSGGCLAPASGPYAFVGFLQNVNVSLLSSSDVYTFDGSATCMSGGVGILTCSGPFVLNAFPSDTVAMGADVSIDRMVTFRDPIVGAPRTFTARVILSGVTGSGTLNVAGLSRYRGTIPAGYATTSSAFSALFFDVATDAVFTSGRVCVEVDADLDGIVDGTTLAVNQLAILHAATAGGAFAAVPLVFIPGFVCADALTSLSPFVLLVNTMVPSTTTTTTHPPTTTTTTTLPPACTTARECLQQATTHPLCEETINPKLQKTITLEIGVAKTKLGKAAAATSARKAARFQKQARAAINAILTKADRFVSKKKGPISSACRDAIRHALAPVLGAIDASKF